MGSPYWLAKIRIDGKFSIYFHIINKNMENIPFIFPCFINMVFISWKIRENSGLTRN
jgi:hypothetical protein